MEAHDDFPEDQTHDQRRGPGHLVARDEHREGGSIGVPKTRIHSHRLALWERNAHRFQVLELPDRSPINREDNTLRVPKKGVGVEVFGGIEPEVELLLFVTFALCIYIGVDYVWVSA